MRENSQPDTRPFYKKKRFYFLALFVLILLLEPGNEPIAILCVIVFFLPKIISSLSSKSEDKITDNEIKITDEQINQQFNFEIKVSRNKEIPELQGDYAKAVFLWRFDGVNPVFATADSYPRYFLYECGITDAIEYHKKLVKEGYFRLCSENELLSLINDKKRKRVASRYKEYLDKHETLYCLSEKGKDFLDKHDGYVQIHRHSKWDITWQEYDKNYKPGLSFFDVVWDILNKRALLDKENFGRCDYYAMYEILVEEGKRKDALRMFLKVIYIDFSGIDYYKFRSWDIDDFDDFDKDPLESFDSHVVVLPSFVETVQSYADVYEDKIIDDIYEYKLPIQMVDKNLFKKIIHSVIDGKYDIEDVKKELKTAYIDMVKNLGNT